MSKERIMFWCGMLCMSVVGSFFIYRAGAADSVERIDGPLTSETIASCSLSADGEELHCENLGITDIDEGVFEGYGEVKKLYLFNNDIEFLPDGVFEGLDSLEHLNIEQNKIEVINENTFDGIRGTLKRLYLYDNMIQFIYPLAFKDMDKLETLILQNNYIEYFYVNTFKGLGSLKELSIYGNNVECYPVGLFDGMETVKVSKDGALEMCLMPDNLMDLCVWDYETGTLDCSNKGIEYVPEYAFYAWSLEMEFGDGNLDEPEDPTAYDPSKVVNLDLSGNMISDISFDTFDILDNLKYVNLRGNPLMCKPTEWELIVAEDPNIESGYKPVTSDIEIEVDEGIDYCLELNSENVFEICNIIDESGNSILDCSNKGITSIALGTFKNHVYLDGVWHYVTSILLNNNKIFYLEPGTFSNLFLQNNRIIVLDLSYNAISRLDAGTFGGLVMGHDCSAGDNYIYLNNNQIREIEPGAFDGLKMVVRSDDNAYGYNHIYLDNNHLSGLKEGIFAGLYTALQNPGGCVA